MSFVFLERLKVELSLLCELLMAFNDLIYDESLDENILHLGHNFFTNNVLLSFMHFLNFLLRNDGGRPWSSAGSNIHQINRIRLQEVSGYLAYSHLSRTSFYWLLNSNILTLKALFMAVYKINPILLSLWSDPNIPSLAYFWV